MKKTLFAVFSALLILPLLHAQEQKARQDDPLKNLQWVEETEAVPERLQAGFNHIRSRDMMAMLAFLSSDNLEGREIGTRGYDTAAEYAQSLFSLWGLLPGGDTPKPPPPAMRQPGPEKPAARPERSYLQSFELKEAVESSASASLQISGKTGILRSVPFTQGIDFILSSPTPLDITAPLVFAGYGISEKSIGYDDLAGIDVKDRIVIILSEAPGREDSASPFQKKEMKEKYFPAAPGRMGGPDSAKTAELMKRGALGVLLVRNSLAENGDIHRDILNQQQVNDEKAILPDSRKKLLLFGGKRQPWEGRNVIRISREMADAILASAGETVEGLQKKIAAKYKPASLKLSGASLHIRNQVRFQLLRSANVIGYIEGSDSQLKHQAVVIGAHLDHLGRRGDYIYNGAEDNASGACGVLAMARALAMNPEKPKRSVVFCLWTGEEEGLLGSRWYVEHPLFSMDDTVANFNLDMIATAWSEPGLRRMMRMLNATEGEQLLKKIKPENFLSLSHSFAATDLKNALMQANRHVGFDILYRESPQTLDRMMGGSDHAPFAMAGRPWVFFITGMSDVYHTPADSMDKFSGNHMEKVSRLVFLASFLLADK